MSGFDNLLYTARPYSRATRGNMPVELQLA
jgi:hypothetical protein